MLFLLLITFLNKFFYFFIIFLNKSTIIVDQVDKNITMTHCFKSSNSVLKKIRKKGKYITANCIIDEIITAPRRYKLLKGDNSQKEWSSERQLKTKNNWEKTRVEKAMVRAVFKPSPNL